MARVLATADPKTINEHQAAWRFSEQEESIPVLDDSGNSRLSTETIPLEPTRRRTHWPRWSSRASTGTETRPLARGVRRNRSAGVAISRAW